MAHLIEFTPARRRELFEAGRNLFFYCRGILGFNDMTEDLHWDYSEFLQRPALRKLIFVFRGGLKSSIGNVGYVSNRSIYIQDHATKLVESSSDNAKKNHFMPIYELFVHSRRSDFLWWLYGDEGEDDKVDSHGVPLDQYMRRIPVGFRGWNSEQIDFIRRGELALPSITYGGIQTKFEGWHGDLVLGDDLEGADEDRALAPNDSAWHFVDQRAAPLLKDPSTGVIVVIGTPHGPDPVIHKIRDREIAWRRGGKSPVWDVFWRPIIDSTGTCLWPERFTPEALSNLRQSRAMWKTQFMGERFAAEDNFFDVAEIQANAWKWVIQNRMLAYRRKRFARTESGTFIHDDTGFRQISEERATINPAFFRTFMHCDPKHIKGAKYSDAKAAILVVGVNHDRHVFVLDTWSGDVSLEEFADEIYKRYRKYRPWRVSMGAVGAENWFVDYARMLESGKYRQLPTLPWSGLPPVLLPRLTSRLELTKNHTAQAKDDWIVRQLESWFSFGMIHCRDSDDELYSQIEQVGQPVGQRDLIDCLAQGPKIWNFPMSNESVESRRSLVNHQSIISPADPSTGYFNPWSAPPSLPISPDAIPHHPHTPAYRDANLLIRGGVADGPPRSPLVLPADEF